MAPLLRPGFPALAENATADFNLVAAPLSPAYVMRDMGAYSVAYFHDGYFGGTVAIRPVADPLPRIFENPTEVPVEITFSSETPSAILYIETAAGTDIEAVADPDDTSPVCDGTEEFTVTTAFKIMAQTEGGEPSPILSGVVQIGTLNRPAPIPNQSCIPI